jgi:hypothetical protein
MLLEDDVLATFSNSLLNRARVWRITATAPEAPLSYAARPINPGTQAIDGAVTDIGLGGQSHAWLSPMGAMGTYGGNGNAATVDWASGGLAGGYEAEGSAMGGTARLGLGLG